LWIIRAHGQGNACPKRNARLRSRIHSRAAEFVPDEILLIEILTRECE
jgi:hypothetical protein